MALQRHGWHLTLWTVVCKRNKCYDSPIFSVTSCKMDRKRLHCSCSVYQNGLDKTSFKCQANTYELIFTPRHMVYHTLCLRTGKKSNWTSWDGIIPDKRQSYTGVFWNLVSLSYLTVWTRMYLCVRVCVCVRMSTNPHMSLFRLCLSALLCKGYGLQFWEIALKRIHDYYQWGNFW